MHRMTRRGLFGVGAASLLRAGRERRFIEEVLDLASRTNSLLAVELDPSSPPVLRAAAKALRDISDVATLAREFRYEAQQQAGQLWQILPQAQVASPTFLDVSLPEFKMPRLDLESARLQLYMAADVAVRKAKGSPLRGYAFSYAKDPETHIGPIDERAKTVREVLNMMVDQTHGAAWIALRMSAAEYMDSARVPWMLVTYQRYRQASYRASILADMESLLAMKSSG